MAVRPRVLVIWVLLVALVVAIVVIDRQDKHVEKIEDAGGGLRERMLSPEPIERLGALEVVADGAMHRFEKDPAGIWFYHGIHAKVDGTHAHQTDPVLADEIAKAAKVFVGARKERAFRLDPQKDAYGVTHPNVILLAYRPSETQPMAQYAVGDLAPDGLSRYVLLVGHGDVITTPDYQIENLLQLVKKGMAAAAAAQGATAPAAQGATVPAAEAVTAPAAPAAKP